MIYLWCFSVLVIPVNFINVTQKTSTQWAGYELKASTGVVSTVSGTWNVPSAYSLCSNAKTETNAWVWVGIDDGGAFGGSDPSQTVEQIGTQTNCVSNGNGGYTPQYLPFWEFYNPGSGAGPNTITTFAIRPGDTMYGYVENLGAGNFYFYLQDKSETNQPSFSVENYYSIAKASTAEWVVEAPETNAGSATALTDFNNPVTISTDFYTITSTISSTSTYQWNMITNTGTQKANSGSLTGYSGDFTVTYISQGP